MSTNLVFFNACYSKMRDHSKNFSTPSCPNFSKDWAVSKTVRTRSGLDFE